MSVSPSALSKIVSFTKSCDNSLVRILFVLMLIVTNGEGWWGVQWLYQKWSGNGEVAIGVSNIVVTKSCSRPLILSPQSFVYCLCIDY